MGFVKANLHCGVATLIETENFVALTIFSSLAAQQVVIMSILSVLLQTITKWVIYMVNGHIYLAPALQRDTKSNFN